MAILDLPILNQHYRLANSETFRVISVEPQADLIKIEHPDHEIEEIDLDTWNRLDAHPLPPDDEHIDASEEGLAEIDFDELGVAPGTEAFDSELLLNEEQWN